MGGCCTKNEQSNIRKNQLTGVWLQWHNGKLLNFYLFIQDIKRVLIEKDGVNLACHFEGGDRKIYKYDSDSCLGVKEIFSILGCCAL